MIVEHLIKRWPGVFGEPRKQIEANIAAGGMKPDHMTWQEWCDIERPGYFGPECHWYDPPEYARGAGHCRDDLHHNHQPRIMRWYWASPLSWILPPLHFIREGASIGLAAAITFGNKVRPPTENDNA